MESKKLTLATISIALASIGFGLVPFFAKSLTDAGMASPAVAFYRFALTSFVLLPFLKIGKDGRFQTLWGICAGAAMGVGWIGYVNALKNASVSTVGIIYMTYPIFTVLIAWLGFRDRLNFRSAISSVMILLAALISMSSSSLRTNSVKALFLALMAPIGFGLAINVLTRILVRIPPLSRIACVSLGSVLGLLPLILTFDKASVLPTTLTGWWLIAGIALLTALIPQIFYVLNAPLIGAARTAMAGSIELPTMFFVGWLAFSELLNGYQLFAGIIVIVAIVISPYRPAKHSAFNAPKHGS